MSLLERRHHVPHQLVITSDAHTGIPTPPPPSPGMQRAPFLRQVARPEWGTLQQQVRLDIQSGLSGDAVAANLAISTSTVRTMIKMMAYDARLVRTHQFRPECG